MKLKNVFKLVFVVLISSNLLKAQIFDLSLEDLVKNSAFIVHCKLKNIQSYFNENTKRIYTDIYFENVSSIKGNIQKSEPIKITLYGGTIKA